MTRVVVPRPSAPKPRPRVSSVPRDGRPRGRGTGGNLGRRHPFACARCSSQPSSSPRPRRVDGGLGARGARAAVLPDRRRHDPGLRRAEQRPEPMSGVGISVPAGFQIVRAHPRLRAGPRHSTARRYLARRPSAHLSIETFRLDVDVTANPGPATLDTVLAVPERSKGQLARDADRGARASRRGGTGWSLGRDRRHRRRWPPRHRFDRRACVRTIRARVTGSIFESGAVYCRLFSELRSLSAPCSVGGSPTARAVDPGRDGAGARPARLRLRRHTVRGHPVLRRGRRVPVRARSPCAHGREGARGSIAALGRLAFTLRRSSSPERETAPGCEGGRPRRVRRPRAATTPRGSRR